MECRRLYSLSCPVAAPLLAIAPPLEASDTPPRHPAVPHSPTIPGSPLGQDTAEPSKQLLSIMLPTLPSPIISPKPSCPLPPLSPPDSDQARLATCPPEPLPPIPVTHLPRSPSRAQVRLLLLAPLIANRATPLSPNDPSPSAPYPPLPLRPSHLPRSPSSLGEAPLPNHSPLFTHRPRSPSLFLSGGDYYCAPRPLVPAQSPPNPHLPRSPSSPSSPTP